MKISALLTIISVSCSFVAATPMPWESPTPGPRGPRPTYIAIYKRSPSESVLPETETWAKMNNEELASMLKKYSDWVEDECNDQQLPRTDNDSPNMDPVIQEIRKLFSMYPELKTRSTDSWLLNGPLYQAVSASIEALSKFTQLEESRRELYKGKSAEEILEYPRDYLPLDKEMRSISLAMEALVDIIKVKEDRLLIPLLERNFSSVTFLFRVYFLFLRAGIETEVLQTEMSSLLSTMSNCRRIVFEKVPASAHSSIPLKDYTKVYQRYVDVYGQSQTGQSSSAKVSTI